MTSNDSIIESNLVIRNWLISLKKSGSVTKIVTQIVDSDKSRWGVCEISAGDKTSLSSFQDFRSPYLVSWYSFGSIFEWKEEFDCSIAPPTPKRGSFLLETRIFVQKWCKGLDKGGHLWYNDGVR